MALFVIVGFTFCFTDFSYSQTPGTLYGSTGNVGATLVTIDPVTGAGTASGPHGAFGPVTEIEFRDDGILFGSTGQNTSNIITIDPLTGSICQDRFGRTMPCPPPFSNQGSFVQPGQFGFREFGFSQGGPGFGQTFQGPRPFGGTSPGQGGPGFRGGFR